MVQSRTADEQVLDGALADDGHVIDQSLRRIWWSKWIRRRVEAHGGSSGGIELGILAVPSPRQRQMELPEIDLLDR